MTTIHYFTPDASLDATSVRRLVRMTGDNQVGLAVVAGSEIGVLDAFVAGVDEEPAQARVVLAGFAAVLAGETLVAGDRITTDAQGRAVKGGTFALVTGGAVENELASVAAQPAPVINVRATLDTPKTSDDRPVFNPNIFPNGVTLQLLGCADSSTVRGAGEEFVLTRSTVGDETKSFHFGDVLYLAGGQVSWSGADLGDNVTMGLAAPATAVTVNGSSTGNCNLVPLAGGGNMIVPAAGDGSHDVDLAVAVPVPAWDDEEGGEPTGWWDCTEPTTGRGVITPSAVPGAGKWYLFDVEIPLARFVSKLQLLGAGVMDVAIPNIKTKKILPQWRFDVVLHNASGVTVKVTWLVVASRKATVGALP